ncbi:MAG: hypothetical protein IJP21_05715 [Clostridia bacterium]|nr:hypothetical protein [Clostridia bacterium]
MKFEELISKLNIAPGYPEDLPELYEEVTADTYFCTTEYINNLQEKYELFKEDNLNAVLAAANDLMTKKELLLWANLAIKYLKKHTDLYVMGYIPMPEPDGTLAGDLLMILTELPFAEIIAEKYRQKGFCEDDIKAILKTFDGCIDIGRTECGRPSCSKAYFNWNLAYICGLLFNYGVLSFEIASHAKEAIVLKSKKTGEYAMMLTMNRFHKSGYVLGSAGLSEEEGAFGPFYEESDTAYTGYLAKNGKAVNELVTLDKAEWDLVLKPGDPVVYIHIPRQTDLSPEAVRETLIGAFKILRERFPECKANYFVCRSWLLSVGLYDYLDENSKIIKFGEIYTRYPILSKGREFMKFLFPNNWDEPEKLEEKTSLQRKIKKMCLDGKYIYSAGGVVLDDEIYK